MGMAGTEVAKEAADMILTDDNFASIETAVEEGRTVRISEGDRLHFASQRWESLTILVGVLLGTALPILPLQILWVNMVSSVALTVPLAFEPSSKSVMRSSPHNPMSPYYRVAADASWQSLS